MYFSTHVYLKPGQFENGLVVNHGNADKLNVFLTSFKNDLEKIELNYILQGKYITVSQLKECYKEHCMPSALLVEFAKEFVSNSDKKDTTKNAYQVFFNNITKFREDIRLDEIDYNFICSYDDWMKQCGMSHNTIVGRLQQFKAILNEAVKRDVIPINPFNRFKIPSMVNKKGFLLKSEVADIEKLKLVKKEKYVRDAFLIGCYTGLRISDIKTLTNEHIQDGWINKTMLKTNKTVMIPIGKLFDGKFYEIMEKYGNDITKLTRHIGQTGTANQILKKIFEKAGISDHMERNITFHTSRHTFASLLLEDGVQISTISSMLGHTKLSTTAIYAETTKNTILNDLKSKKKK